MARTAPGSEVSRETPFQCSQHRDAVAEYLSCPKETGVRDMIGRGWR
jgi:hypothetical protein